ncbi:MAG: LPS export ABC transporter permease LptG [Thermodesulfobacteriota bacterium]
MKRLEKYILHEFLKLLGLTLLGFIVLFMLVDLFENMDNLVKYHVPASLWPFFFIYKVPFTVSQVIPVSVLLSVLISAGLLSKHGEITAIRASGVRILRVFVPVFISGFIISVAVLATNEYLTPLGLKRAASFERKWFGAPRGGFVGKEGVWIRTKTSIINIRDMELTKKRLRGFTSFAVEKPFRLKRRVNTRLVQWEGGRWVAPKARVWTFNADGSVEEKDAAGLELEEVPPPDKFYNVKDVHRDMNMSELKGFIRNLEADGYETYRYRTDLYNRVAFPFISFIMVFLGIPFALKSARAGGIAAGVAISVLIAFSYWIVFALAKSLGAGGIIPPLLAAALPDMLFLATGALMLDYVRE